MSETDIAPSGQERTIQSDVQLARELLFGNWLPFAIVFVVALALAALFIVLNPSQYVAQAVLLVQPQADSLSEKSSPVVTPELVRSQVDVIQSQPVLERVVHRLSLDSDPEFAGRGGDAQRSRAAQAAEKLSRRLAVDNDGRSYVIRLQVRSRDPKKAAQIANAIAEEYVGFERAQKVRSVEAATLGLSEKVERLRRRAENADAAAETFRRSANLVLLSAAPDAAAADAGFTATSREALEAARQKAELEAQRALADAHLQVQQSQIGAGSGGGTSEVMASPVINRLKDQEAELERTEANLLAKYKPDHPLVAPVHAQLLEVRRAIAKETDRVHGVVRAQSDAARRSEELLNGVVTNLNARVSGEISAASKLRQLRDEARIQRGLYEEFAAQAGRAAQRVDVQLPDILIVSPASPPMTPTSPKKPVILAASVVLGLVGGAAASTLSALARPGLSGPMDTARLTGLPVVWAPERRAPALDPARPMNRAERASMVRLMARALRRSKGRNPVVISIALANGAPSALAACWARELSRAGAAVLLIGDDAGGLAAASGERPLRVRRASDLTGLVERDPSFTTFRAQIEAELAGADFVLVETEADDLLLAAFASTLELHLSVLVVGQGATTKRQAQDAARGLQGLSIHGDGVVIV